MLALFFFAIIYAKFAPKKKELKHKEQNEKFNDNYYPERPS